MLISFGSRVPSLSGFLVGVDKTGEATMVVVLGSII